MRSVWENEVAVWLRSLGQDNCIVGGCNGDGGDVAFNTTAQSYSPPIKPPCCHQTGKGATDGSPIY